mgnify:CR=1 FL=1
MKYFFLPFLRQFSPIMFENQPCASLVLYTGERCSASCLLFRSFNHGENKLSFDAALFSYVIALGLMYLLYADLSFQALHGFALQILCLSKTAPANDKYRSDMNPRIPFSCTSLARMCQVILTTSYQRESWGSPVSRCICLLFT